jgi:hypothetical protein
MLFELTSKFLVLLVLALAAPPALFGAAPPDQPRDLKAKAETWWSLAPVQRPSIPGVSNRNWVRTPIDAFLLAALEKKGLKPAAEADRLTLIRRLSFDLRGLPPSPAEIDTFLNDSAQDAYEQLVDRFLDSPRYGERWARHWLDVVHYGDTHGYDKDKRRDHAWPYRDFVIRSFNADKPYSRFVEEQLAGDVLFPGDPAGVIATGFIAAGPWDFVGHVELREGTVDKEKTRVLDRDDMVASTMGTFASLTVHCARCHNHKFDPIPRRDYYRLQAVFAGVDRGDRPIVAGAKQPVVYAAVSHAPRPIYDLKRGDVEQRGEQVTAGPLSCLPKLQAAFASGHIAGEGEQRARLAHWLTDPHNPLTWRSIVNRVWHYHFGRGLVDTPNDFGRNGSLPSNPALLDWMASEFRDHGQSIKALNRLIVTSAAYRQKSINPAVNGDLDADNRLLWRMDRRRLDAEEVRDSVLAVSGSLREIGGGPSYEPFRFKDDHSPIYDHADTQHMLDPATFRRTIFAFNVRSVPNPFLECLDSADPNATTPVRSSTVTPLQALALLNDPFMIDQSERFARRLREQVREEGGLVRRAFRETLGRSPTFDEYLLLIEFVRQEGLPRLCRYLMNTNEFLFVD